MKIRPAVESDLNAVNNLFDEFFSYLAALQPDFCFPAKSDGSYFQSILLSEEDILFVAENDGVPVGMLHLAISKTPPYPSVVRHRYGEVIDFIVTKSFRHQGIGLQLIKAAKSWCADKRLDYVELLVLENAEDERRFYEKNGFETAHRTMRLMLNTIP